MTPLPLQCEGCGGWLHPEHGCTRCADLPTSDELRLLEACDVSSSRAAYELAKRIVREHERKDLRDTRPPTRHTGDPCRLPKPTNEPR